MVMSNQNENPPAFDYSKYVDAVNAPDDNDVLGRITIAAEEMKSLDHQIAEAELHVKKLKAARDLVATETLPELMDSVGLTEVKTRSGLPVKIVDVLHTSIAKERKPLAIAWLDKNGHGGMVRRNVIIDFDKTQEEKVQKLLRLIGKGWPNNRVELDVNGATVKAFVKRRLDAGEDIPLDIFGVHQQREAQIKS